MNSSSDSEIDEHIDLKNIVEKLKTLSQLNIGKIVQIIKRHEPEIIMNPDEFDINFSELKTSTIRLIKSFIRITDGKNGGERKHHRMKKSKKVEFRVKTSQKTEQSSKAKRSSDKDIIVLSSDSVLVISSD